MPRETTAAKEKLANRQVRSNPAKLYSEILEQTHQEKHEQDDQNQADDAAPSGQDRVAAAEPVTATEQDEDQDHDEDQ